MSTKAELLQKLKALADHGVGGESDNAAALLARLMKKYGVTEEDLSDERREDCEFRYSNKPFEEKLLHQIIYMVMGKCSIYRWKNSRKQVLIVACTKAEKIEIEAAFAFYSAHLATGLEHFYRAFIAREELMPDNTKEHIETPNKELSFEEMMIAAAMEKHERHLAIEAGAERRRA